jgi:hypothetical protein
MARALPLQGRGRGFESLSAHRKGAGQRAFLGSGAVTIHRDVATLTQPFARWLRRGARVSGGASPRRAGWRGCASPTFAVEGGAGQPGRCPARPRRAPSPPCRGQGTRGPAGAPCDVQRRDGRLVRCRVSQRHADKPIAPRAREVAEHDHHRRLPRPVASRPSPRLCRGCQATPRKSTTVKVAAGTRIAAVVDDKLTRSQARHRTLAACTLPLPTFASRDRPTG